MYDNVDLSCEQSRSQCYIRFSAVKDLARDEIHYSVCCSLFVPHLARPSRLCRGRARPWSGHLPARRAVFVFMRNSCSDPKCLTVRIHISLGLNVYLAKKRVGQQVGICPCAFQVDVSNPG